MSYICSLKVLHASLRSICCLTIIDINRNFVNNTDLNEENSLTHLIEYLDPIDEGEVNPIHHSNYYSNEEFKEAHKQTDVKLSILNLNCQCINSKFDQIKLFLEGIDNNSMPDNGQIMKLK